MTLSIENILESYEQGDVVLIEELLKMSPENEDLKNIEERCWTHEYFKENGESYEDFKEDYAKVVTSVIGQDFVTILEENGH